MCPGAPPAAETDGPVAVALVAHALRRVGREVPGVHRRTLRGACRAALAGVADVPLDVVPLGGSVDAVIATWRARDVRLAVAIERCGRTADGTARNMRGDDIGAYTTLLDDLFLAGPWRHHRDRRWRQRDRHGVAAAVARSARMLRMARRSLVSRRPAHLIVAGVSHWGAYALIGGLAVTRA